MTEYVFPKIGTVGWFDLTVPADQTTAVRDFYCAVAGWQWSAHSMGDYDDYNIQTPDGDPVTGICHAIGFNANLPTAWLIYITVADVAASVQSCIALGGKVLDGPRPMGASQFAVIQDPAGAVVALISPPNSESKTDSDDANQTD